MEILTRMATLNVDIKGIDINGTIIIVLLFADDSAFLLKDKESSKHLEKTIPVRPGKKNFGSGQLIFENWSGGPVAGWPGGPFFIFLNNNINIQSLIVQKVLKLEIQIKLVLKTFM